MKHIQIRELKICICIIVAQTDLEPAYLVEVGAALKGLFRCVCSSFHI